MGNEEIKPTTYCHNYYSDGGLPLKGWCSSFKRNCNIVETSECGYKELAYLCNNRGKRLQQAKAEIERLNTLKEGYRNIGQMNIDELKAENEELKSQLDVLENVEIPSQEITIDFLREDLEIAMEFIVETSKTKKYDYDSEYTINYAQSTLTKIGEK